MGYRGLNSSLCTYTTNTWSTESPKCFIFLSGKWNPIHFYVHFKMCVHQGMVNSGHMLLSHSYYFLWWECFKSTHSIFKINVAKVSGNRLVWWQYLWEVVFGCIRMRAEQTMGQQASKQHSAMASASLPPLGSCFEFLPQLPSRMLCNL